MVVTKLRPERSERDDTLHAGDMVSAYRIEGLVGSGGMGWVYRASHALTRQVVALKVLRYDQLAEDHAIDRMMREATILASVDHPGLPDFYECGVLSDRRPWIAMELVLGTPLQVEMAKGPMSPDAVRAFVRAVARVLAAAHARGVAHRDLKPDNIFLTAGQSSVRVIDWGIAHHCAGARYTNHDEAIGTPTYMSPEQARGGPADGYCDVYGLGVVAYQALVGKPPFVGHSSVEVLVQHLNRPAPALGPRSPDAPLALVSLVEKMLAKKPGERPAAAEVVVALDALDALAAATELPTYATVGVERTGPVPFDEIEQIAEPATVPVRVRQS